MVSVNFRSTLMHFWAARKLAQVLALLWFRDAVFLQIVAPECPMTVYGLDAGD